MYAIYEQTLTLCVLQYLCATVNYIHICQLIYQYFMVPEGIGILLIELDISNIVKKRCLVCDKNKTINL